MKSLSKEDLYKITIVTFIFIVIVLITLFTLNKKNNFSEPIEEPDEKQFTVVTNYNLFFFVNNHINTFIQYSINQDINGMLGFLDEQYKTKQNIHLNNIQNFIPTYHENDIYKAKLTKSYQLNENITVYYTEGNIVNEGYDETTLISKDVKYLLYVDFDKMVCSLEIVSEEKKESDLNKEKSILENSYNQVKQIEVIDSNRICSIYMADLFNKIAEKKVYSIVTNFKSNEDFDSFYNNNYLTSEIKTCNMSVNEEGKRIYTMIDKNNYHYSFRENNILDYTVSITK